MGDIVKRLRDACDGQPHAKIEWPHRVLHEAADEIERLRDKILEVEMMRRLDAQIAAHCS